MIYGETIEVWAYRDEGCDVLNNQVKRYVFEGRVGNVLVVPASTHDLDGSIRPDGDKTRLTLHLPKSCTRSLRGCMVRVRDLMWEVEGDPQGYTPQNVPGPWDRQVNAVLVEG